MTLYVNIGSNQGDRKALIEQAIALIIEAHPGARVRLSDFVESEPWGYQSASPFLNIGMAIAVDGPVEPTAELRLLLGIQHSISAAPHRGADGGYCDRPIDIDLIAIDKMVVDSPELQLPHPRAALREFVMKPMRQLAPRSLMRWLQRQNHSSASSISSISSIASSSDSMASDGCFK